MLSTLKRALTGGHVPVARQLSAVECGAACLAMILSYHGREATVAECREMCGAGRDGSTALAIAEAARGCGLAVRAYTLEPEGLRNLPLPAIVHWNFNHFVVVEKLTGRGVVIVDPAGGRRRLTRGEFDDAFTGVVLTFEPGPGFEPRWARKGLHLKYLLSMSRLPGAKAAVAQILLASLIFQLFGLVLPLFTKLAVDTIIPARLTDLLAVVGAGALMIVAAQTLLAYLRGALLLRLRARLDARLTHNFFEHLLALPLGFFRKRTSGDLLLRLSSNSYIREILTAQAVTALLDGFFVLTYLIIILSASPAFGLLVTALGAAQLLVILSTKRRLAHLMQSELAAKAEEHGYLVEAVKGVSVLKSSGAEGQALDKWTNLFFNHLNLSVERGRVSLLVDTTVSAVRTLSPLLILWLGAGHVVGGRMSVGEMLALSTLSASFLAPVSTLVASVQQFHLVGAHLERVADVLDAEVECSARGGAESPRLSGQIEVRDLHFRYASESPDVLRGLSFEVGPGQKVALVGPTGSGKSTLAMLLLGLYQPSRGGVLYDGIPAERLDPGGLRRRAGVVLQESFLFNGTIRQNITLKNPAAPFESVVKAARLAAIHDEIARMPMGYETPVAEAGLALSGGQRQRLALARALLNAPAMLVLDEATSHLDAVTEAEVERNLSGLACSRVVIAHRLTTVRNADLILALEGGRIVERGTHEELLALKGLYAELVGKEAGGRGGIPPPDSTGLEAAEEQGGLIN